MRILSLQKMLEGRGKDDLVNSIAPLSPKRPLSHSDSRAMSPTNDAFSPRPMSSPNVGDDEEE